MIHLIEVGPELLPKDLKKMSRKFAMTGGYELALKPDLSAHDLELLVDLYANELLAFASHNAEKKASNAYRILLQVSQHQHTPEGLAQRVRVHLDGEGL